MSQVHPIEHAVSKKKEERESLCMTLGFWVSQACVYVCVCVSLTGLVSSHHTAIEAPSFRRTLPRAPHPPPPSY